MFLSKANNESQQRRRDLQTKGMYNYISDTVIQVVVGTFLYEYFEFLDYEICSSCKDRCNMMACVVCLCTGELRKVATSPLFDSMVLAHVAIASCLFLLGCPC
jgi:hypothetical protein